MELHQLLTYTYFVQINTMCIVLEKYCETLYLISTISKGVLEWPNSLRVVRALISIGAVLDSYCPCTLNYFLFWSGYLLISCLQSFQIISHLSYFPTAVSMVSFTVLDQLLSNQLILWKKAVMLGVDCVTSEAALLISMKIPPPPKKKLAMICRPFTVPYFSVRLSKSTVYQYGWPYWFHMYQGDRGWGL